MDFQSKNPVDADWNVLLRYANHVRKITYDESLDNVPVPIFPVFKNHSPVQWILPNLTHLVWKSKSPDGLDRARVFLKPGLQSLALDIGHKSSKLSDLLTALSEPKLNAFSLSSLDNLPEDFPRLMIRQDLLKEVSIVAPGALNSKVGKWVSGLPELNRLKLDLTGQSMSNIEGFFDEIVPGWSTPSSGESRDSGVFTEPDSTEVKKTTEFIRSGHVERGAYPQLRRLHLIGKTANAVAFLKQSVGLINTLELSIEDPPEDQDWKDLCAVICDTLSASLRSLRILSAAPVKEIGSSRSPGRVHDPIHRRLPLSHFTSLPRLAEFEIDLPESVVFYNSDIAHVATICPAIEVLKLCPQARWPSNLAPPSVTLVRYPSDSVRSTPADGSRAGWHRSAYFRMQASSHPRARIDRQGWKRWNPQHPQRFFSIPLSTQCRSFPPRELHPRCHPP